MNPDRIYSQYRDDAFADQIAAEEYSTFVAMPFKERFSYQSLEIYKEVIKEAAQRATKRNETRLNFASPKRIDEEPGVAGVITEDIIVQILKSHLFLADLTFENPGVLLEVGIALGLKPNNQIILILQGDPNSLHFDIRNNRVIQYNKQGAVDDIASAFIAGAKAFEHNCMLYIESISRALSSDAMRCLRRYGDLYHKNPKSNPSLHLGNRGDHFKKDANGEIRFIDATRELLANRLLWSDYRVERTPGVDAFGMRATKIGYRVIEHMWPKLNRS